MNEQFQQVYDYLQSSGQLSEETTQDSFYQKYSGSDADFNRLYQRLSLQEDLPFELYDREQFRADLFSVEGETPLKKKTQEESFQQVSPSVQASMAPTSGLGTPQPGLEYQYYDPNRVESGFNSIINGTAPKDPIRYFSDDKDEAFELAVSAKKKLSREVNIDWANSLKELNGAPLDEATISRINEEINPGGWRYIANNSGWESNLGNKDTWDESDLRRIREAMAISDFKENYVYQDPESGDWTIGERNIPEEDLILNRGNGDYYNFRTDKIQQFRYVYDPNLQVLNNAGVVRGGWIKTWDYETDYLTGWFGDLINSIPFLGDFIDDTARALGEGYRQTETYDPTRALMAEINEETVNAYYESAVRASANQVESAEMEAYRNDYAKYSEEYGEWWGWFAAGYYNPGAFWDTAVKSYAGMLEDDVIAEGSKVVAIGTGTGAAIGSAFAGVGAVPGAIEGFSYSIPFAMAAMGREVEILNSFNEFLREEIDAKGYEFSPESVLEVLSDEEAYGRITSKARARGNTIAAIDAAAGGIGGGAMRSLRAAGRIGEAGVITRQSLIDVASGSGGELSAELAAGQEISAEDILLEGFTGPVTQTPANVTTVFLGNEPVNTIDGGTQRGFKIMPAVDNALTGGPNPISRYRINGEDVSRDEFSKFIETNGPDILLSDRLSLSVDNDQEMGNRMNQAIEKAEIESSLPDDLTGEQRQRLIEAETQLKRLRGMDTKTANRRRKELESEIDAIFDEYAQGLEMPAEKNILQGDPNKIFSGEPVSVVKKSVQDYADESGMEITEADNITQLDVDNAKAIADAFDQMEHKPYDPEVRASYEAMAKETMDQFGVLQKNGVKVVIYEGEGEPYKNSAEMLKDLRENNQIFILSTEKDFGTSGITDQQRAENPLLADSGIKDYNGKPLLVNDVFRAVHDFFGHGERGNSFGAIGEENAWDVHARMYSPLARRAMTTETRGQNSWVNFGPQMRNDKGQIIKKGEEGYLSPADRSFAPQKIGLLPEEMSEPGQGRALQEQITEAPTEEQRAQAESELNQRLKEEDVFLGNQRKGVKESLSDVLLGKTRFQRRLFSARRFMPRSVFNAFESKNASTSATLNRIEKKSKDFQKLEMSIPEDQRETFYTDFDNVLRGGDRGSLSNEAYLMAIEMRADIDRLSMDLINSGLISESQIDVVSSNLGEYMNIAYAAYDQPGKWKDFINKDERGLEIKSKAHLLLKQTDTELIERAKSEFKSNNPEDQKKVAASKAKTESEYLDYLVEGKIQDMLSTDQGIYSKEGQIGSGDESILKQRVDMPEEISSLLGRYDDPLQNYVRTVYKIAALNESTKFNNSILESGLNTWLFENPGGENFNTEVKIGDKTYYTTPEIANELNNQYKNRIFEGEAIDFMLKFSGAAKWMKTIGSVGTHSKNVVGNLGFMVANGHLSFDTAGDAVRAFQAVYADLRSIPDAELRQRMQKYIELGIVKQSTGLGEIKDILAADDFESAAQSRLDRNSRNRAQRGFEGTKKFAEDMYQAEDDFFKIMAYESEHRRYSEAMFGLPPDQLTEQQLTELDDKVAEIVKNTFPTYSRVPSAIEFLKRNPFIGNFISFQAESYRTAWNIVDLAQKEIKSDNPAVRKIGLKRMAGVSTYMGAKGAILSGASVSAGMGAKGLLSMGEDQSEEEKQRESDIRRFVPFWSEDSELFMTSNWVVDGKFSYVDFSASDPWGGIDKVVNSYKRGETFMDGLANVLGESIEPFVGADIASRRVLNLIEGRDDYGKDIWLEDDTNDEKFAKALTYMYGVFEPGTVTSMRKVYEADEPYNELMGQMTGYKESKIDVKDQMFYKLREHGRYLRQDLGVRYKDLQEGSETFEVESYRDAIEKMQVREALIREDVMAAIRLGVDYKDLIDMMKSQLNISQEKAESILAEDFIMPPVTPSNR